MVQLFTCCYNRVIALTVERGPKQEKRDNKGGDKIAEEFVKEREDTAVPSSFCISVLASRSGGVGVTSILQWGNYYSMELPGLL